MSHRRQRRLHGARPAGRSRRLASGASATRPRMPPRWRRKPRLRSRPEYRLSGPAGLAPPWAPRACHAACRSCGRPATSASGSDCRPLLHRLPAHARSATTAAAANRAGEERSLRSAVGSAAGAGVQREEDAGHAHRRDGDDVSIGIGTDHPRQQGAVACQRATPVLLTGAMTTPCGPNTIRSGSARISQALPCGASTVSAPAVRHTERSASRWWSSGQQRSSTTGRWARRHDLADVSAAAVRRSW
jgi:hypothetical protein